MKFLFFIIIIFIISCGNENLTTKSEEKPFEFDKDISIIADSQSVENNYLHFYKLFKTDKIIYTVETTQYFETNENILIFDIKFNLNFTKIKEIVPFYKYFYSVFINDFTIEFSQLKGYTDIDKVKKEYEEIINFLQFNVIISSFGRNEIEIPAQIKNNKKFNNITIMIFTIINNIFFPLPLKDENNFIISVKNPALNNETENLIEYHCELTKYKESFILNAKNKDNFELFGLFGKNDGLFEKINFKYIYSNQIEDNKKTFVYKIKNFFKITKKP